MFYVASATETAPRLDIRCHPLTGESFEQQITQAVEELQVNDGIEDEAPTDPQRPQVFTRETQSHYQATVHATKIHTYHAVTGACSFWRFQLEIPMTEHEQTVLYTLNGAGSAWPSCRKASVCSKTIPRSRFRGPSDWTESQMVQPILQWLLSRGRQEILQWARSALG